MIQSAVRLAERVMRANYKGCEIIITSRMVNNGWSARVSVITPSGRRMRVDDFRVWSTLKEDAKQRAFRHAQQFIDDRPHLAGARQRTA